MCGSLVERWVSLSIGCLETSARHILPCARAVPVFPTSDTAAVHGRPPCAKAKQKVICEVGDCPVFRSVVWCNLKQLIFFVCFSLKALPVPGLSLWDWGRARAEEWT